MRALLARQAARRALQGAGSVVNARPFFCQTGVSSYPRLAHRGFTQGSCLANGVRIRMYSSNTKTEHLKPGQTHYSLLGVQKDATVEQIKAGFRTKAKEFHPDTAKAGARNAEDEFKNLQASYAVLTDPELKAEYDRELRGGWASESESEKNF